MKLVVAILLSLVAVISGRTLNVEKTAISITDDFGDEDLGDQVVQSIQDLPEFVQSFSDFPEGTQFDPEKCKDGKCSFCAGKRLVKVCFVATLRQASIELSITFNGHKFAKVSINVRNPPPICHKILPFLPSLTDVCVQLRNVDLKRGAGCVYVSFKVKLIKKKISFKVACFTLKKAFDEVTAFDDVSAFSEISAMNDTMVTVETDSDPVTEEDNRENSDIGSLLLFKSFKQN